MLNETGNTDNQWSHERLVSGVLSELLNPRSGMNRLGDIYERLLGRIQHYSTHVQTLGGNWLLDRLKVNIGPGQSEYLITDACFAYALLVETHPDSLPWRAIPARVEIVNLEDLTRTYGGERIAAYGNQTGTTATVPRAVAFWVENQQTYMRTCAMPASDVTLQVFFEPTTTLAFNPKEAPNFLPAFWELLKLSTAYRSLPLFRADYEPSAYLELSGRLAADVGQAEALLDRYATNDHNETAGPMRAWGQQRR